MLGRGQPGGQEPVVRNNLKHGSSYQRPGPFTCPGVMPEQEGSRLQTRPRGKKGPGSSGPK